jgi:uncharacterized membrane protein YgdD (TMEM256/DUF423 family)
MNMHKGFLRTAAFLGALTVALGAFGAHGLKKYFPADAMQVYETAVRYQFYHVLALLAAGILYASYPSVKMKWAGYLFITGIILFCGSLYFLSYLEYDAMNNMKWVGAVTPFGGAAFIGGWVMMGLAIGKKMFN